MFITSPTQAEAQKTVLYSVTGMTVTGLHWYCRYIAMRNITRVQRPIHGPHCWHMLLMFISVIKLTTKGVFYLYPLFGLMDKKCRMTLSSACRRYERVSCSAWLLGRPNRTNHTVCVQLAVLGTRRPDFISAVLPQS
jgi:hypothetical protein